MNKLSVYKHTNNTDVAFMVRKVTYQDSNVIDLKVIWLNIVNLANPLVLFEDRITIQKPDLKNWHDISSILSQKGVYQ